MSDFILPLIDLLGDHPIAITGLGALSAAGPSAASLWEAAQAGNSTAVWRDFPESSRFAVCPAPAPEFSPLDARVARKLDRSGQLAFVAAREAWDAAGLDGMYPPERIGVSIGSSRGPFAKNMDAVARQQFLPSFATQTAFASIGGALAQSFKLQGVGGAISAACASAAFAIISAAEQIVLGRADAMLAGGTDAALHPVILQQLRAAGVLGFHEEAGLTCRPFALDRNGFVLGEGSGFLVLERLDRALARGAVPRAILAGWASGNDDSGRIGVRPDGAGLTRLMQEALRLAAAHPGEVDYINAHGTGTKGNDAAESRTLVEVFAGLPAPLCSSTKPVTGHCLGATPALEAIICIEALAHQTIPPAINCPTLDPESPVNLPREPVVLPGMKMAMSNSLGFWGYQSSLVFKSYPSATAA